MIKESPILFSTPMVQAILEGRKTQTRRIMKPQIICDHSIYQEASWKNEPTVWNIKDGQAYCQLCGNGISVGDGKGIKCRYGKVGDLLWVRETWQTSYVNNKWIPIFKADGHYIDEDGPTKWKPSIHMLKKHARVWLEVTNIKVERLQDISEEEAIAEGVENISMGGFGRSGEEWKDYLGGLAIIRTAATSFKTLWVKINGSESLNSNPWVWAVSFKILSTKGKP